MLSVDGVAASLDVEMIRARFDRAPGARVVIEVERGGTKRRLVSRLLRQLPD